MFTCEGLASLFYLERGETKEITVKLLIKDIHVQFAVPCLLTQPFSSLIGSFYDEYLKSLTAKILVSK